MTDPEKTPLRIGSHDLHRVLASLGQCEFLKNFKKTGRARYARDSLDGIQHGVEFSIERRHGISLVVTPVLTIDHKQARRLLNALLGGCRSKHEEELPLLGTALGELARNPTEIACEYGFVPSALKKLPGTQELLQSRSLWRSMDQLEDVARRIDSDLQSAGPQFFQDRDRTSKVIEWLKSDPGAGGTATRIILVCLLYVQGQHDEISSIVDFWTAHTANPMELQFAKRIGR